MALVERDAPGEPAELPLRVHWEMETLCPWVVVLERDALTLRLSPLPSPPPSAPMD